MNLDLNTIIKINKIIERDKLESSYKLALLKSIILVIKKFDHHIIKNENYVRIPFYFIVEEWFFYYIPFVYLNLKQHKSRNLVLNKEIEELYKQIFIKFDICEKNDWKCIYSIIYKKYFNFELNVNDIFKAFRKLIINNPMKYIGEHNYEFFSREKIDGVKKVDRKNFKEFGFFEIDKNLYNVFKYLGDNFYGLNTIIFRWEELLNRINHSNEIEQIKEILTHNISSIMRDTTEIKKLFKNQNVFCVWSGKKIKRFDIDHLFPFSIFMNNDYWNLLPTTPKINNDKRDKIPSPEMIENSKNRILEYWNIYKKNFSNFNIQRNISLGYFNKEDEYILQLKRKSKFFIDTLGYRPFELKI